MNVLVISSRMGSIGMRGVLAGIGPGDNGRFLNHDGEPIAW